MSSARSGLVGQLVKRVVADPRADLQLGLGLVTAEHKKTGLQLLAQINAQLGADYRKISNLALVGVKLCGLNGLLKQQEQFKDLYMRACWGRKLSELDISFKTGFNGSKGDRMEILKMMVSHPQADIELLLQFAKAFNIYQNDVLTLYSEALLLKLEPVIDARGEVVVDKLDEVTAKVEKCLDLIKDDNVLYEHLTKMFSELSPYNYAVLEFILRKLYQTKVYREERPQFLLKADKILGFLMQYKRVSSPQAECEVDHWIKDRGCPLPSLANQRLPLYSLVMLPAKDKYKWLEKEFTLDTFQAWMTVAKTLSLVGDNICYFAVKNTVTTMLENSGENEQDWILGHVNKNILENIEACIKTMSNCEKATAASNWVVNRLPRGEDKVLASIGAETIVQSWVSRSEEGAGNETVRKGLEMSIKTRRQLETEQVLHKHNLADKKYINLVYQDKPLDLLMMLYEDDSIEKRNAAAAGNFPDINSAENTIATIHEINLQKVKHELLDKWLPVSVSVSHDDTMADFTLNLNTINNDEENDNSNVDDVNLLRCVYLLQAGDGGLQYLLKYGFSQESCVSTHHKLRALKCLFSICSDEKLAEVTGKSVEMIKHHMKTLMYLARLEAMNLPYTMQSLDQCSKTSLVESVWKVRIMFLQ